MRCMDMVQRSQNYNMIMNFNLEQNEAQFLLQLLGELPTRTGALPLLQKWEAQFKAQMPKQDASTPTEVDIVSE